MSEGALPEVLIVANETLIRKDAVDTIAEGGPPMRLDL